MPQQKTKPDQPGRWWFQGTVTKRQGTLTTVDRVQNRPFTVGNDLVPTDPDTGQRFDLSRLTSVWVKEPE
jgi:hypothetical protein